VSYLRPRARALALVGAPARLAVLLVVALAALTLSSVGSAASTTLVINEVDYAQPLTDTTEFYELKNVSGGPLNIDNYRVELINGNGNVLYNPVVDLPNLTLAAGAYFVVCANAALTPSCNLDVAPDSNLIQNGDPDGLRIMLGTTTVDALSYGGDTVGATEGAGAARDTAAVAPAGAESLSRCADGSDSDRNNVDFSLRPSTPGAANSCPGPPPENKPVAASCGGALTVLQGDTATRQVTAMDPDGTVTSFTATSTPAASGISISSQTPAGAAGGTASATVSIAATVAPGTYVVELTATNADATPQTASCSFSVTVTDVTPIGELQGIVGAADNGPTHRSPFAPPTGNGSGTATVVVRAVVYQKTLAKTTNAAAPNQHGFFIQNTAAQADGNPFTSDGIWVFLGSFTTVLNAVSGGPAYTPQVGDEIVLSGRVSEFFNFTQISSPRFVEAVGTALDLDVVVPATTVNPPADLVEANRYWERLESMRLRVPANALVTDGLDVFPSTADAEMWLVRGDSAIAARSGYAQRVFRDAHPLDDLPGLVDNGNGFRILVGALGLKSLAADNTILLPPSRTFDTVQNALVGGLNFSFSKYRIETNDTPSLAHGLEPALNAPPSAGNRGVEYSVGDYNVENLYDFRDDPFDGCDFVGNLGCSGVNPPFDYVPASNGAYQERLGLIAEQIVGDLHAPDVILVQEAEDQDICTVSGGTLTCGAVNNADGKPDTLQELALRIKSQSGISYDAAYDRDGSDDRGIVAALMYRTDRVELLPVTADHPVLGSTPDFTYRSGANAYNADVQNPKSLNAPLPADVTGSRDGNEVYTRDPQVGLFRVWRTAVGVGAFTDVYAISNHFSSTPDSRVLQRTEQAAYLAKIVETLDADRVVTGGDFNVFPRPDDPLVPASDQLRALYELGLHSVWETMVAENPAAAYSYVFVGQAQTLDWQFLTPTLHDELVQSRVAHVNADYPAEFAGDGARGLSDHDPMTSRFEIPSTLEGLAALVAYYCQTGAITGNNTCTQLQQHLDRVPTVGDVQLEAFIGQVRDKTPRFITPTAAGALVLEAQLLLQG
jgi:predicted extracellular nuclease